MEKDDDITWRKRIWSYSCGLKPALPPVSEYYRNKEQRQRTALLFSRIGVPDQFQHLIGGSDSGIGFVIRKFHTLNRQVVFSIPK